MGGAQPLAATMNGACFLGIEVDPARIEKRLKTGYCDRMAWNLDEALALLEDARRRGEALSVGSGGQLRRRASGTGAARHRARYPDRPDQRARRAERLRSQRHDARPRRWRCARPIRTNTRGAPSTPWGSTSTAMLALKRMGAVTFDYGNNIRAQAKQRRRGRCVRYSRLRARIHPAAVLRRARAVPLGGAVGIARGHPRHRSTGARTVSRQCSR